MPNKVKTNVVVGIILHAFLWSIFFKLAISFLHSSQDPWYQLARGDYFPTFIKIQISLLPYYLAIGLVFCFFVHQALTVWNNFRPSSRRLIQAFRYGFLFVWFWMSWVLLSCVSYYTSWLVPFSMLEQNFGIHVSHRALKAVSPLIYLNFTVLMGLILFSLRRYSHFVTLKRVIILALLSIGFLGISFLPKKAGSTSSPSTSTQPNIVIIGSDALRADRLGAYGYTRPTSPHIDVIAHAGVIAERMYVASPSTSESLLSMLTGLTPRESGVRSIFYGPEDIARVKSKPGIVPALQQKGYRTVALGDWSGSDLGRLADFDFADVEPEMTFVEYIDEAARRIHLPLLAFFATPLNSWMAPNFVGLLISRHTVESALTLAEKEIDNVNKNNKPLFMFIFLSTTHLPYAIPEGEPITFGDPHYKGKHERQLNFASLDAISSADLSAELKGDSQRIHDLYDSTVWRFDRQVARIDAALQRNNLKNTIFIVLADHGEDQWDPGVGLSRTLHAGDQSIRIPFIMRWPDHLAPHQIPNLLRATDIVPTLADLVDAPWDTEGKTFKKLLEGESFPDDRSVFIESGISWTGPTLYPPNGPHLSYPGVTSLAVPDRSIESQLLIPRDRLALVMKAKDRVFIQGRYKVAYQPMKSGPLVDMCDLLEDPSCQTRLKPDATLAQKLKEEIIQDPEDFYLAWPRNVFEAAFIPSRP